MPDDAIPVDHECDPPGNHAQRFLPPRKLADPAAFIAEEREGQLVLRNKLEMRFRRVVADPYYLGPGCLELLEIVPESTSLDRAAGGIVLRVEIDHYRAAPAVLTQPHEV